MSSFDTEKKGTAYTKFFTGAWKAWEVAAKSDAAAAEKVSKVKTMFADLKAIVATLDDPTYAPAVSSKKRKARNKSERHGLKGTAMMGLAVHGHLIG